MWWQQRFSEFVTLFLVVNPFGPLPTFLTMAARLEPPAQRQLALGAAVISFAVLVFFVFAGALLLRQVGIPIRAFQISGGIVLFLVGLDMIRGRSYAGEEGARDGGPGSVRARGLPACDSHNCRTRRHAHRGAAHR